MPKGKFSISPIKSFYSLETLSKKNTIIHNLNPLSKIIASLFFILVAISFNRYNIAGPLYLFSYPFLIIAIAELPMKNMISRILMSLPVCFFLGFSDFLLNRVAAIHIANFPISYGFIAFIVIIMRMFLTVSAVTVLMATTPFPILTKCLLWLRVPRVFILVIEMSYRYLGIIFIEKQTGMSAYILRSNQKKRTFIKNAGSFAGTFFMKNTDRAKRLYFAMKLRGYRIDRKSVQEEKMQKKDFIFLLIMALYLVIIRVLGNL
jgi:cobalt/nickel transport system permease protein